MKHGARCAGVILLLSSFLSGLAVADEELDEVRKQLSSHLEQISPEQVQRSTAPGLFEVQDGMAFGYLTPDGRYLVQGELIDLKSGELITEQRRNAFRARRVAELAEQAIVFAPDAKKIRHQLSFFVDVDCEYCRELHREIPALNAAGVAVNYLFYPRRGEKGKGFAWAQQAYCAEDHSEALDQLLSGQAPENAATDCPNPVGAQLAVARELEVRGTPMIVMPDGSIHYGYMAAQEIGEILDALAEKTR